MKSINSFYLSTKADIVIVDGRVSKEIISNLKKLNLTIIPTIRHPKLYDSISFHPDIVIHPINYNALIIAPNVFDYYSTMLTNTSIKLIKGEKVLKRNYPNNIAYNVARIGKYAIHNIKYTDEKLVYYLKKEGIDFINVNQGYTKCSVAVIDSNAIITSDLSIYKECKKLNIDILLVKEGYISLPGLNYGFIGGCTGMLSEKEILFSGDYTNHPDKEKINTFLNKYNKKPVMLSNKEIIDIGSIISLLNN